MHILLLLLVVALLSWSNIDLRTQIIVETVILIFCIPDLILGFRKSPPFIPSFKRDIRLMMRFAAIKKNDVVIDPGCGDGRLVFEAARQGATATGYEFAVPAYLYAKIRSFFHPRSSIRFGDFWKQDYSQADVVFCYLLPDTMKQFYTKIWPQLKPGCRVVSNSFSMKTLKPDKSEQGIHLYIK
ncbi:class I SAM-dependent methyltransferase [Candidatus Peribacteria bacterium]|nr:MAG: class I SAM-dependent methyltransferase [Candidatus Peribacteria bacterium]